MDLMKLTKATLVEQITTLQGETAGYRSEIERLTSEVEALSTDSRPASQGEDYSYESKVQELEAEVARLTEELAALKTPRIRRPDRMTFAQFCSNNPELPVISDDRKPCRPGFCPDCNTRVQTNQYGVCRHCAPVKFGVYTAAQRKAA